MAARGWNTWQPQHGINFAPAHAHEPPPLHPDLSKYRVFHSISEGAAEAKASSELFGAVDDVVQQNGRRTAPPTLQSQEPYKPPSIKAADPSADAANAVAAETGADDAEAKETPEADAPAEGDEEPPVTTLDYKVPVEAFRAAKHARPGTAESFWSYTLYRGPDGEKVKVHYCRSKHTTERVCQYFLKEKVIGFDLEWMPDATRWQSARRNVCLVQLASQSRIALFHLALYPKTDMLLAPSLKRIMEDPEITKVGVFIKGDCTRLRNFLKVESRGIFELSHLFKLVKYSASGEHQLVNKKLVSLAAQVQEHLRLPLFKGHDVRSSDWSKLLRMDQIIYSSSDAYAAVQLYNIMENQRENLDPIPPLPHHAELNLPIRLADGADMPALDDTVEDPRAGEEGDETVTTLSPEFVSSVNETIQMEAEGEAGETASQTTTPSKSLRSLSKPDAKPKDVRILAAENWVIHYRAVIRTARAAPAALRSYHIWKNNTDLNPTAVAALLRDPPLQTSTVLTYILEAIKWEKLPFDADRLRVEVLDQLHSQMLASRYPSVMRDVRSASLAAASASAAAAKNEEGSASITKAGAE